MIAFFNPRSTKPHRRRHPYSILALAAMFPDHESLVVDGNVVGDPIEVLRQSAASGSVEAFAFTVMPGPQLVSAVTAAKRLKSEFPAIPMIWGGYFPSLYPAPAIRAPYVDFLIKGQGERALVELIGAIRDGGGANRFSKIAGLVWKDGGDVVSNAERPWEGRDEFPQIPFHRVSANDYISPSLLGRRTAAYFTSIGCPYTCSFCGVISVWGSRQRFESIDRTVSVLEQLVRNHGVDSLHFWDNNFFLKESHSRELADRITPLRLSWWCEARIDAALSYSDATWRRLRDSGCRMIFFGAESGSDASLARMNKRLTTEQTLELARRIREWGITPEFSFCLGDPLDPEGDIRTTLSFIRRIKEINPSSEIVLYFYHPTPQQGEMYGQVEERMEFPGDLDVWCSEEWLRFQTHTDPHVAWIPAELKRMVDEFDEVEKARFPSAHDAHRLRPWGRTLLRALAGWRWESATYGSPVELRWVRDWAKIDRDSESYGHFRGTSDAIPQF